MAGIAEEFEHPHLERDMSIDLSSLSRKHVFYLKTSAFGQVFCGAVNDKMLSKLVDTLHRSDVDGFAFARQVLQFVCTKFVPGDTNHALPTEEALTVEEILQITDEDLEDFADEFIAHNVWLLRSYKEGDRQITTNEKGERVVLYQSQRVQLPKDEGEKNSNYLVRVFRHYFTGRNERETKTMGGTSTVGRFAGAERHLAEYSAIADMERVLRRDQEIMQALDPFRDMKRLVESNATFDSVLINLKREQELMQSAARQFEREKQHIEEISRTSILAMSIYHNNDLINQIAREESQMKAMSASIAADIAKQQLVTCQLIGQHEMMFRLPQPLEVSHLLEEYPLGAVAKLVQQQSDLILDQQRLADAISTPWLNSIETARSVSAILELQSIGNALVTMKGFEPGFTVALRKDLGDWRDKITFPEAGLIDPVTRTEFYIDRGFNSALTDFPYAAFHQGLDLAGLGDASLDLELYGTVAPQSENPEETGLRRTNRCHDRLQRFERQLRQFIDKEMTVQYGSNWPKKRLAPKTYESWEFKKQRAENNGITLSFIEVADFTDYEAIICKQDHWRELFERRFKRKESVRESLQRLQPIRLTTMHARIVTKEDELYLVAEIIRLIRAIN